MNTSWKGIKFICCREALVIQAYPDGKFVNGVQPYSFGFGNQTHEDGSPVLAGDTISIDEAFARVRAHVADVDKVLSNLIKIPLLQHQWDAVTSLAYQSKMVIVRVAIEAINTRPLELAFCEFAQWHSMVSGLAKRRIREMYLGSEGYYGDISKYPYYGGDPRTTIREMKEFPDA